MRLYGSYQAARFGPREDLYRRSARECDRALIGCQTRDASAILQATHSRDARGYGGYNKGLEPWAQCGDRVSVALGLRSSVPHESSRPGSRGDDGRGDRDDRHSHRDKPDCRTVDLLGAAVPGAREPQERPWVGHLHPVLLCCDCGECSRQGRSTARVLRRRPAPSRLPTHGTPRPDALAEHGAGGRLAQGPASPAATRRPGGPSLTKATARAAIPSRP